MINYGGSYMIRWTLIAVLIPASFTENAAAQQVVPGQTAAVEKTSPPEGDEFWEVIYMGDKRIGYSHVKSRRTEANGKPIVATTMDLHLTFKRLGDTTTIKTRQDFTETMTGEMLSFEYEVRNPPKSLSRTIGKVDGRFLRLETLDGDRKDRRSRNWDPQTQSPMFSGRSLQEKPLKPGEIRTFFAFLPELDTPTQVKFAADEYRFAKLLDGKQHKLLLVRMTQSVNPTMTTRAWFDAEGRLMLTETNLLGDRMLTYRVSEEEALKEIAGEELDLIVNTMVPVGPIRNAHRTSKVAYRIKMDNDNPGRFLVKGGTQQIQPIDNNTVELTVTKASVPALASKETVDAEYLKSTRLLQSEDYRVRELAKNGSAGETDPVKVAFRLERYVHSKLKSKNFSTALASAAEVAASLEGDCTEHAMLLAAALRARQIPSRIVIGLVYVESVQSFGGHMWTEAFLNGAWIPLDATLGQGGIGGGHIKLAESSMSDDTPVLVTAFLPLMEVLGKMKIEVLRAE